MPGTQKSAASGLNLVTAAVVLWNTVIWSGRRMCCVATATASITST